MEINQVDKKICERYSNLHPLIVHRSIERAASNVELFDILHTCPQKYPILWSEDLNCWITTEDHYLSCDFTQDDL